MFEEGAKLKAEFGAENVYDFSLGNPDIDPPAEFFSCLKDLAGLNAQGVHGYMLEIAAKNHVKQNGNEKAQKKYNALTIEIT